MKLLFSLLLVTLMNPIAHAGDGPCFDRAEAGSKYYFQLLLENVRRDPNSAYWGKWKGCLDKEVKWLRTTSGNGGAGVYYTYWFGADCDWTYSSSMYANCSTYGE